MLEALDFQWKKPLSVPQNNCGTKKRRREENENEKEVCQLSNSSKDNNVDTSVVVNGGKEVKNDDDSASKTQQITIAIVPLKTQQISIAIDTDDVNYESVCTGAPTAMSDGNYEIGDLNEQMVTDSVKFDGKMRLHLLCKTMLKARRQLPTCQCRMA